MVRLKKVTINVAVQPQAYDITLGYDIIDSFILDLAEKKYARAYAIITDTRVKSLYGEKLRDDMIKAGIPVILIDFPEGEHYKSSQTKVMLDEKLLEQKFGRDCAIIALGGGVVGDIAGFVAATYMRGIRYIQIPTTIVAQADSSIGGKTAIDYPQGKNLIGAFHHPFAVFMDVKMLESLDDRNYRNGLIEVLKHGFVKDKSFYDFFIMHLDTILERKGDDYPGVLVELMRRNSKIKNAVVSRDPKEINLRKILNYGHTIGHAIEHLSGFALLHGEAVAIGIAVEAFLSFTLSFSQKSTYIGQIEAIKKIGLPFLIPDTISTDAIIETMYLDKKTVDRKVRIVLLERIGKVKKSTHGSYVHSVGENELRRMIDRYRNSKGEVV
jgi:3-dehydroquinate synthase